MALPESGARGALKSTRKSFVLYIMTRNNTMNKVHVASTELQQLLKQNTGMQEFASKISKFFWR